MIPAFFMALMMLRIMTAKKVASKGEKAVKASKAGIKNSRQAVKAADRSARAAQKTAQVAAKAPQRAAKAARATAKAGAATARETAKASLAAIKGAVAAAQELIAALAAGGWAVVAVVLVLCMVGLLIASPFGLFFSNAEGNGSGIPQAVAQLNGEFTARIEQIKEETPCDVLDLDNDAVATVLDNWRNVLAVYAVRASADGSSPSGLDGLTAENLALLREVFWDMNQVSSFTETVPRGEDDSEIVLHISAIAKTPQEMAVEYGFTDEQKELLEELLKPEYQELFQTLIGSSQDLTLSVEQVQEILDSLPDDLSEERRQVILTAYQLLGKVNYFWGGKSLLLGWDSRWGTPKEVWAAGSPSTGTVRPYGLDCSGFVDWVFYNVSGGTYVIGHGGGARMQHTYCTPITWAEAVPGDLVFYPEDTHVGIVCGFDSAGNVQVIHCAGGANNVVVTGKSGFTTIARPKFYS
jgi:cell wall-associated NlpC family hydrolase